MRIGDFVEGYTTGNARSAIKDLSALAPQTAIVVRNGEEITVPISEVEQNEIVVVRPGEAIPVDGDVVSGNASVDQSAVHVCVCHLLVIA